MTVGKPWRRALSPPAEVSKFDTGLRFTDILFGFVIRELFLRLQNWSELPGYVRWQLIAGTALVLGSWIGFRRSLNRSSYELKFFNLPLARFVLDQLMIIFYFRVAVLTPNPYTNLAPDSLASTTTLALLIIFGLYACWDLGGIWMARAREAGGTPKYGVIEDGKPTKNWSVKDWRGFAITAAFLALFAGLFGVSEWSQLNANETEMLFIAATALLLAYRWAKEIKTTWR